MPPVSAPVCGEAEYLIYDNNLLVSPLLILDLEVDVEQLIQSEEKHFWPVAISHGIFVM